MNDYELFAFCNRQVALVRLLEKLKLFTVIKVCGSLHPITDKLMCHIFYVKMKDRLYRPVQHLIDRFIDRDGKSRIEELERIGLLERRKDSRHASGS